MILVMNFFRSASYFDSIFGLDQLLFINGRIQGLVTITINIRPRK